MNTTIKWQIVVEKYHVTPHGFNEHSIARNLSTGLDGTAAVTSHLVPWPQFLMTNNITVMHAENFSIFYTQVILRKN
jgi:hypothetical protein